MGNNVNCLSTEKEEDLDLTNQNDLKMLFQLQEHMISLIN